MVPQDKNPEPRNADTANAKTEADKKQHKPEEPKGLATLVPGVPFTLAGAMLGLDPATSLALDLALGGDGAS